MYQLHGTITSTTDTFIDEIRITRFLESTDIKTTNVMTTVHEVKLEPYETKEISLSLTSTYPGGLYKLFSSPNHELRHVYIYDAFAFYRTSDVPEIFNKYRFDEQMKLEIEMQQAMALQ